MALLRILRSVPERNVTMSMYTVKERLCLTEDDKLVPEGEPEARWLFAIPGDEIPVDQAERYGLLKSPAKPTAEKSVAKSAPKSSAKPAAKGGTSAKPAKGAAKSSAKPAAK